MSQKPAPQRTLPRKETKPETNPTPVVEQDVEEMALPESFLDKIQPHLATIALVILAVTLGFVAIQFWQSANFSNQAMEWVDLSQAKAINAATGDVKDLTRVADEYNTSTAGLIGAMYAGDSQLRSGINQLAQDREAGLELVKKAKNNYQSVVDASDDLKSEWLLERSRFSLAYAYETLGEFSSAKILYKELIDSSPDSPLIERAKRGLKRTSSDQYAELYQTFRNYESTLGDAPGPAITDPNRPTLDDLGGTDLPPGELPPTDSPLDKVDEPNNDGDSEKMDPPTTDKKEADAVIEEGSDDKKSASPPAEDGKTEGVEKEVDPKKMDPETPSKEEKPAAEKNTEKPTNEEPKIEPETGKPSESTPAGEPKPDPTAEAEKPGADVPVEKPAETPAPPKKPEGTTETKGGGEGS